MAFAAGDDHHWWEPGAYGGRFYWPPEVTPQSTLDAWVEVFTREGYVQTDNRDNELGFEKVAIYVDPSDLSPSHVAKSDGTSWKSKLGKIQDIEHRSLDLLEGDQHWEYGIVDRILKREIVVP